MTTTDEQEARDERKRQVASPEVRREETVIREVTWIRHVRPQRQQAIDAENAEEE